MFNSSTFEIVIKEKDIIRNYRIAKTIIGSHAIFNYLTVLQNQITFDHKREALTGLSNYAKFVRNIMQQAELESQALSQEHLQLSMYLRMEQLRFGDSLSYEIDIDEAHAHTSFPVFVSLPFLELLVASVYKQTGNAAILIRLTKSQIVVNLNHALPLFSTLERNEEQSIRYHLWLEQIHDKGILFEENTEESGNTFYTITDTN